MYRKNKRKLSKRKDKVAAVSYFIAAGYPVEGVNNYLMTILNSDFEQITQQNYHFLEYAYDKYFIATNEQNKVGVIDLEEKVVVEFKYDIIQLIKGKSIFQAIDFETNFLVPSSALPFSLLFLA